MTCEDIYKILSSKFPTAQTDWTGHEKVPKPPYAVYLEEPPKNIPADNRVYISENRFIVELYTVKRDYQSEKAIEKLFDENDVYWTKDKNWNRELNLYQTIYKI